MNRAWLQTIVVALSIFVAYFTIYPEDLDTLLPIERLFRLTVDVSPWLYGLVAVVLVCRTIERVWGRSRG